MPISSRSARSLRMVEAATPNSKRSLRYLEPTGAPEAMYSSMTDRRTRCCRALSANTVPLKESIAKQTYAHLSGDVPPLSRHPDCTTMQGNQSSGGKRGGGAPVEYRDDPCDRDRDAAACGQQQALAGARVRAEVLDLSRWARAHLERRHPRRRVGEVRPAATADGAHGAGAEADVGSGAPVRHVVARPAPRQGVVADLIPAVAAAGQSADDPAIPVSYTHLRAHETDSYLV